MRREVISDIENDLGALKEFRKAGDLQWHEREVWGLVGILLSRAGRVGEEFDTLSRPGVREGETESSSSSSSSSSSQKPSLA